MDLKAMIDQVRQSLGKVADEIATNDRAIAARKDELQKERRSASDDDVLRGLEYQNSLKRAQESALKERLAELEEDKRKDDAIDASQREFHPTGARMPGEEDEHRPSTGESRTPATTGPRWVRTDDGKPAAVARGQRFADHEIVREAAAARAAADQAVIGHHGSLAQMVRAMTTTGGSAIVPTVWASNIIDRARNLAAVLRAGAEIVPMDAKTVNIGRLTGDPTAAFRTEGSAITASDPTFDNVTLTAKTMSALTVGSIEWFQDADNADQVVEDAIAQAFAQQIDLVSLYGGETAYAGGAIDLATPPNPRGVLAALEAVATSSVLGGAANGTAQTAASYFDELLDLVFTPRAFNEAPNALIYNTKLALQYAKAYASDYQPLRRPVALDEVEHFVSNQVPSYTQGTMASRATDVFAGDWTQLLIGQRLDLTIQVLTERYAENGQVGIVANWRGDVQPARPRAFAVYQALQGAS